MQNQKKKDTSVTVKSNNEKRHSSKIKKLRLLFSPKNRKSKKSKKNKKSKSTTNARGKFHREKRAISLTRSYFRSEATVTSDTTSDVSEADSPSTPNSLNAASGRHARTISSRSRAFTFGARRIFKREDNNKSKTSHSSPKSGSPHSSDSSIDSLPSKVVLPYLSVKNIGELVLPPLSSPASPASGASTTTVKKLRARQPAGLREQKSPQLIELENMKVIADEANEKTPSQIFTRRILTFLALVLTIYANPESILKITQSIDAAGVESEKQIKDMFRCLLPLLMLSGRQLVLANIDLDPCFPINPFLNTPVGLTVGSAKAPLVNGKCQEPDIDKVKGIIASVRKKMIKYDPDSLLTQPTKLAQEFANAIEIIKVVDDSEVKTDIETKGTDNSSSRSSSRTMPIFSFDDSNDSAFQRYNHQQLLDMLWRFCNKYISEQEIGKIKINQPESGQGQFARHLVLSTLHLIKAKNIELGEVNEAELRLLFSFFMYGENATDISLTVDFQDFFFLLPMLCHCDSKATFSNITINLKIPGNEVVKLQFDKTQLNYLRSISAFVHHKVGAAGSTIHDTESLIDEHLQFHKIASNVLLFDQAQSFVMYLSILILLSQTNNAAEISSEKIANEIQKIFPVQRVQNGFKVKTQNEFAEMKQSKETEKQHLEELRNLSVLLFSKIRLGLPLAENDLTEIIKIIQQKLSIDSDSKMAPEQETEQSKKKSVAVQSEATKSSTQKETQGDNEKPKTKLGLFGSLLANGGIFNKVSEEVISDHPLSNNTNWTDLNLIG